MRFWCERELPVTKIIQSAMEVWLRRFSTRMFSAFSPVRICIVSRRDRGFLG